MKHPSKLIAIHGLKGSGKDLTASMLQKYILNSERFAFGDKLKRICSVAFDVPLNYFHDEAMKERGVSEWGTPRGLTMQVADTFRSHFGDDFFAHDLRSAWAKAQANGKSLIVTDLRFPVELRTCRKLGAVVVHVQRPATGLYSPSTHSSEAGLPLDYLDSLICNTGTKSMLLAQVRQLICVVWGPEALKEYPFVDQNCFEFN